MKATLACALVGASLINTGRAAIVGFTEDFTGATLDPAWSESGLTGTFDATNDLYSLTSNRTLNPTAPKLQRNEGGTLGSFSATIALNLLEFSNPSTGADFKWKFFGPDGFTEIVLNSFGNMRMFHNDQTPGGGAGNIQPNTNIGLTGAGDLLELSLQYNDGTDTLDVFYSLNAGPSISFYSGGGIDGPVGDLVTNFVQIELFEFGLGDPVPTVQVQEWNLTAIPEPSASVLLLGCFGLAAILRRRRR